MRFGRAVVVVAYPPFQFVARQEPPWLHRLTLAMVPIDFDRIEPGALDRQATGQEAYPLAAMLHGIVVLVYPGAHGAAQVPGGVVPDHDPNPCAAGRQPRTTPVEEVDGDGTYRAAIDKAQPDFIWLVRQVVSGREQQAIAGQRLRFAGRDRLLYQAQGASLRGPCGGDGWAYPAPPCLILEAPGPSGLGLGQGDQSVPAAFFRAYSGSGLSTQRLARRQLLPKRRMAPRIVS